MSKTSGTNSTGIILKAYWRRFAEWVTGFASKYRTDQLLRTESAIVLLQVVFALLLLGVVWASFVYLEQDISNQFIAKVIEEVAKDGDFTVGNAQAILAELKEAQQRSLSAIIGMIVLSTALFGYALARFALTPTRHAFEAQKQFIANVAHELRTPLSVIKTNTEVALLGSNIDSETRDTFKSHLEELDRISNIINNLLSLPVFTRPEKMTFAPVDLANVVDTAVADLQALADRRRHTIQVKKGGSTIVWGNVTALEQVATNLLKNALNYTPEGRQVTIEARGGVQDSAELIVEDTGVGIPEKDLPRIFEPFYRAEASRSRALGSAGLGLTIVSELVKLHRGFITIDSEVGRGTNVTVTLPRRRNTGGFFSFMAPEREKHDS